jgi:ubiquinone biosynthesis monooxygenase Coq7
MPRPYFHKSSLDRKIAEIIRVDHAGEYGAKRIYEGQLKFTKNKQDWYTIHNMLLQEEEHLNYFAKQIKQGKGNPTFLIPLWNVCGYLLGCLSAILGTEIAMLTTQSIEDVIEEHYQEQIDYLKHRKYEGDLLDKIVKFREDEIHHKNLATNYFSLNHLAYNILGYCIKQACKVAIFTSKRI